MEPASYAVGAPDEVGRADRQAAGCDRPVALRRAARRRGLRRLWPFDTPSRDRAKQPSASAAGMAHILAAQLSTELDAIAATLEQLAAYSRRNGGPSASGEAWIQILATAHAGLPAAGSLSVTDRSGDVTFRLADRGDGTTTTPTARCSRPSSANPDERRARGRTARAQPDRRPLGLAGGSGEPDTAGELDGIVVATIAPARLARFLPLAPMLRSRRHRLGALARRRGSAARALGRQCTQEPWPNLPLDLAKPAGGEQRHPACAARSRRRALPDGL